MKLFQALITPVFCIISLSCTSQGRKQPVQNAADDNGFAIVELFTSEGCSSCPAADDLLARIDNEYKQHVYVMEFHVDYWNYIGWKDVFSSPEYTARQRHYAGLFHLSSTYTPQAIVNGKVELVGSENGNLHAAIDKCLQNKPSRLLDISVKMKEGSVDVSYAMPGNKEQVLNIAVVQKKAETNVRRGENSGRKLKHINVVRALVTVDNGKDSGTVNIQLPEGLSSADVAVIAYTQLKDTWTITAATEAIPYP